MIDLLKYILLGFIQGVSEVLPISSSAHLIIASNFLGVADNSLTFEIFLHFASLIAVMAFLWKKFIALIKGFCLYVFKGKKEFKTEFFYCLFIVVSTIPTVIFTLIFGNLVDEVSKTLWIVGLLLIINGFLLFFITKIKGTRKKEELTFVDALVIGCFQCAGIFPGISRSGSCLCGAFTRKIDKEDAADYAFMMFIPAVVGAFVLELLKFDSLVIESKMILPYIASFAVALFTTFFAFKFLLTIIKKGKLSYFSFYCFTIGLITLVFGLIK